MAKADGSTASIFWRRAGAVAWIALVAVVVVAAVWFHLVGGRWFIIDTPSMGTAAPVGSLNLTLPVSMDAVVVGDVISFRPPTAPAESYTHRVREITAAGAVITQGDINGAVDPWQLGAADIVGRSIALIPILGFVIRGLPILLVGVSALWFVTGRWTRGQQRASSRILGLSVIASGVLAFLKPLLGFVVVSTSAAAGGVNATVVSTGLLPLSLTAEGGGRVDLVSGQVGHLFVPTPDSGNYHVGSAMNLPFYGWVILVVLCCLPLLWTTIVGLPPQEEEPKDSEVVA